MVTGRVQCVQCVQYQSEQWPPAPLNSSTDTPDTCVDVCAVLTWCGARGVPCLCVWSYYTLLHTHTHTLLVLAPFVSLSSSSMPPSSTYTHTHAHTRAHTHTHAHTHTRTHTHCCRRIHGFGQDG